MLSRHTRPRYCVEAISRKELCICDPEYLKRVRSDAGPRRVVGGVTILFYVNNLGV
jgi:hypothetical protein